MSEKKNNVVQHVVIGMMWTETNAITSYNQDKAFFENRVE